MLQYIVERLAAEFFPVDIDLLEVPLFVHGHAAVVEQVGIVYLIQSSLGKKELHMLLQLLAFYETMAQPLHHLFFFRRQFIGLLPVHRGKIHVLHGIGHSV